VRKWLYLLVIVFFLAGCNNNPKGLYDQQEDRAGKALSHNEKADLLETDRSRGWQMGDQNPNLPNMDGGRVDQDGYIDKARNTVNGTEEFKVGSVWTNGNRMWVTAYKKGQLTREERMDAEARLHKLLTKAIPRYEIEVKVQEDRT